MLAWPVAMICSSVLLISHMVLKNRTFSNCNMLHFLMQTEKVELETTVVDETKEREAHGLVNGRFSGQLYLNYSYF